MLINKQIKYLTEVSGVNSQEIKIGSYETNLIEELNN